MLNRARLTRTLLLLLLEAGLPAAIRGADEPAAGTEAEKKVAAPTKVDVSPIARDPEIRARLLNILRATEWFADPTVDVKEGIVFLCGQVEAGRDFHSAATPAPARGGCRSG